jgi:hypothetical protein
MKHSGFSFINMRPDPIEQVGDYFVAKGEHPLPVREMRASA